MTEKILGWPEPTEVGGHMVKRSNGNLNDRNAEFTCVDCGKGETGGVLVFQVGITGCPKRPESLNYLSLLGWYHNEGVWPADPAMVARDSWSDMARRIGLKVEDFEDLDEPDVCARFTFTGVPYELRYNQPGSHGVHHIHAVKIEEA
jgi:hypothetical protein